MTRYLIVFEDKGEYYTDISMSENDCERSILAGEASHARVAFKGQYENARAGWEAMKYVEKANAEGKLDSSELEKLLK